MNVLEFQKFIQLAIFSAESYFLEQVFNAFYARAPD